jgi:hypothetical protein
MMQNINIGAKKIGKRYKLYRIVDGKPRWIIVDEHRDIINKTPTKEELKLVTKWNFKYNSTGMCEFIETNGERCTEKLCSGNAR